MGILNATGQGIPVYGSGVFGTNWFKGQPFPGLRGL